MDIPPFFAASETPVQIEQAEVTELRQKYNNIVGAEAYVTEMYASYSGKWGFILRVFYKPTLDGHTLAYDKIFLCWKPADGPVHFVSSGADEEASVRKSADSLK